MMEISAKRRALRLLPAAALALLVIRYRSELWGIATVFALAGAFSVMLAPLCTRLERRGMKPGTAAGLSLLLLLLGIGLAFSAFIPYLITHSVELVRRITPTMNGLLGRASELLAQFGVHIESTGELARLLASSMSALTAHLAKSGVAFAAQAGRLAFSIVLSYYFLCDRQMLLCHLLLFLPLRWRTAFLEAMQGCGNDVMGYLCGVLKTSAFVGGATFLGLMLLGVRDALLLGLFMGLFELLPYVGPILASIPILLSTLPQGLYPSLLALALVIAVQQVEGNFVSPYFTASSTSIDPLTAVVSVFVLGCLFGLWGILLAVPLVVTARSLIWSIRQSRLQMSR